MRSASTALQSLMLRSMMALSTALILYLIFTEGLNTLHIQKCWCRSEGIVHWCRQIFPRVLFMWRQQQWKCSITGWNDFDDSSLAPRKTWQAFIRFLLFKNIASLLRHAYRTFISSSIYVSLVSTSCECRNKQRYQRGSWIFIVFYVALA